MPENDPQILQVPVDPPASETGTHEEKQKMPADLSENVANQMLTQLVQSGTVAQNNFITVQKAMDFDYLENKRMVTIDEAVGVREVASNASMAGKPAGA